MVVLVFRACLNGWQATQQDEQYLLDYKTQSTLTANFINLESGSIICMNFILIGSHATENQTRLLLLLLFEVGTFGQNMVPGADVIQCGYHGNDTSADPNMVAFVYPPR